MRRMGVRMRGIPQRRRRSIIRAAARSEAAAASPGCAWAAHGTGAGQRHPRHDFCTARVCSGVRSAHLARRACRPSRCTYRGQYRAPARAMACARAKCLRSAFTARPPARFPCGLLRRPRTIPQKCHSEKINISMSEETRQKDSAERRQSKKDDTSSSTPRRSGHYFFPTDVGQLFCASIMAALCSWNEGVVERKLQELQRWERELKRREAALCARERQEVLRRQHERPGSPDTFGPGPGDAAEELSKESPRLRTSKHAARSPRALPPWISHPREPGERRYSTMHLCQVPAVEWGDDPAVGHGDADAPSRPRSPTPPLLARSRTPSMTPPLQRRIPSLTPSLTPPLRRDDSPEATGENKGQACARESRANAAPGGGVSRDDTPSALTFLSPKRRKRTAAEARTSSAMPRRSSRRLYSGA